MASHHRRRNLKIGYRDKKGSSYAENQTAVAAAGEDIGATANDTDSSNTAPKAPAKISRAKKNW